MSTMAEVLAKHRIAPSLDCACGAVFHVVDSSDDVSPESFESDYEAHQADALTKAGYGKLADAWDEGHRTYVQREMDDCRCGAYYKGECGCGKYGTGKIITPNPYRTEP